MWLLISAEVTVVLQLVLTATLRERGRLLGIILGVCTCRKCRKKFCEDCSKKRLDGTHGQMLPETANVRLVLSLKHID